MPSPSEPSRRGLEERPASAQPSQEAWPQVPPPPAAAVTAVSKRLHPAALGVWALSGVRGLVLLLVAGSFNIYAALVFGIFGVLYSVARWARFEWRLEDEALVIEQGVVQRQRRVIPLERIQSVQAVRKLQHRVLGVVELRVESIGAGSTEGQLDALSPQDAAALRAQLLRRGASAGPSGTEAETDEGEPLVRMEPRELVLAGITGGRVGVFAAIIGFASQAMGERLGPVFERFARFVGATEITNVLTATAVLLAAVFVIAFVLSVIATTVTFWDFTLTRDDRNLYTTRGLLDQRSGTIPLHRIQSVRMEENVVRRLSGLAAVRVEVAGQGAGDASEETSVILPLGTRQEALDLVDEILGRDDVAQATLGPMPVAARSRRMVRAAVVTILLTAAATWWFGPEGLAALVLALPFGALAQASYRALGHAELDGLVLARSGLLVRTTYATAERSLQAVAVTSTPFQRRRDLATLVLHIARSPGGGGDPAIIDVPAAWANTELLRLAAASDRGTHARHLRASRPFG